MSPFAKIEYTMTKDIELDVATFEVSSTYQEIAIGVERLEI